MMTVMNKKNPAISGIFFYDEKRILTMKTTFVSVYYHRIIIEPLSFLPGGCGHGYHRMYSVQPDFLRRNLWL